MKKQLLTLACVAAVVPAITLNAQVKIEKQWMHIETNLLNDGWPGIAGIGTMPEKPCTRFGTGMDGKVYTINLNDQTLVAIDATSVNTVAQLPASDLSFGTDATGRDYYGTAISHDDAGNFLLGHRFTQAQSNNVWSVFNPQTKEIKHFTLPVSIPARLDCVGRVVGDMTRSAVAYLAPANGGEPVVYMVKFEGDGTIASINATATASNEVTPATATVGVAQPFYATAEETLAVTAPQNAFLYSPAARGPIYYITDGIEMSYPVVSNLGVNGFDSFVLGDKRYFVRSYQNAATTPWTNVPSVGVFDESGRLLGSWVCPEVDGNSEFFSSAGYSSINAEIVDDSTVNIYVFCSTGNYPVQDPNVGGACAVMLTMTVVAPTNLGSGTEDDPYQIVNTADLCDMHNKIVDGQKTYFVLNNDIDMEGITDYIPAIGSDGKTYIGEFVFDGQCHVIKNFAPTNDVWYQSIFGVIRGSVKNLGIENCDINCASSGTGVLGGYAGHGGFPAVIDNVWVTGKVKSAGYTGGLVGTNAESLTITNSYFNGDVDGTYAGGLVGRGRNGVKVENCYAYGKVTGSSVACGLVGSDKSDDSANAVAIKNAIAWNAYVNCDKSAAAVTVMAGTMENVLVWDSMEINGVKVAEGKDFGTLISTAMGWDAYADEVVNGLPALKWQVEGSGAVEGIIADEDADAAPVYYNLQGAQVEHPAAGLYIVKRGNKVTKEIIR